MASTTASAVFAGCRSRKVTGAYKRYLQTDEPAEALANFGEFQILCALRNGPYGVGELNRLAEQSLSEAGLLEKEGQWYRGRPVMITRNDLCS